MRWDEEERDFESSSTSSSASSSQLFHSFLIVTTRQGTHCCLGPAGIDCCDLWHIFWENRTHHQISHSRRRVERKLYEGRKGKGMRVRSACVARSLFPRRRCKRPLEEGYLSICWPRRRVKIRGSGIGRLDVPFEEDRPPWWPNSSTSKSPQLRGAEGFPLIVV